MREKRPFLITITAPAGTGKTRLLEEFLARLPGEQPTAQVVTAQCLPYGQRLTYWPLHAPPDRTPRTPGRRRSGDHSTGSRRGG